MTTVSKFPVGMAERLNGHLYRLIDPRNGETVHVGKGQGDRVFQHAKLALALGNGEDATDLKFQRMKDIRSVGLDVARVIQGHNIDSAEISFPIEVPPDRSVSGLDEDREWPKGVEVTERTTSPK